MTIDFLVGAIRASADLHPQVKTELEEILHRAAPVEPVLTGFNFPAALSFRYECPCGAPLLEEQPFCSKCGRPVMWA